MTNKETIEVELTENLTQSQAETEIKEAVEEVKNKRGAKAKTKALEENVGIATAELQTSTLADVQDSRSLKVFKLNEHTQIPSFGTKASACFDIRVNLKGELDSGNTFVTAFTKQNQSINRKIETETDGRVFVELRPYERLIAPTGAIFDIPEGFSLKVHPRSGTSLKQGINLINQEAVIDADFVEELKLLLVNSSESYVKIYHDERYAQGELQVVIQTNFEEVTERPQQKTDRTGGLGHTGTK